MGVQLCNAECHNTYNCTNYRYNNQTKECTLMNEEYRGFCNIKAGPIVRSFGIISFYHCNESYMYRNVRIGANFMLLIASTGFTIKLKHCVFLKKMEEKHAMFWEGQNNHHMIIVNLKMTRRGLYFG